MRVSRRRSRWNERVEMCVVRIVVVGAMLSCLQRILDGRAASTFQQPALSQAGPRELRNSQPAGSAVCLVISLPLHIAAPAARPYHTGPCRTIRRACRCDARRRPHGLPYPRRARYQRASAAPTQDGTPKQPAQTSRCLVREKLAQALPVA
jgi:hypothetical protein